MPVFKVLFVASLLPLLFSIYKDSTILNSCISILLSATSVCLCSYCLGLSHNERLYMNRIIATKLNLSRVINKIKS